MWKRIVRSQEFIVAIGILVLSIVITAINPNFFTVGNLFDLLRFITVDGLLALGVLIVLISGGVDVSFPAIANFSTYLVVTLLIAAGFQGSVAVVYLLALPLGLLLGLVNGFFVSYFRLPTLIVTLGTSSLYYGAMLFFFGSANLFNLPPGMIEFSKAALTSVTSPDVGTTALHPVDSAADRGCRAGLAAAALYADRPRHLCHRRQSRCGRAHRLPHSSDRADHLCHGRCSGRHGRRDACSPLPQCQSRSACWARNWM